MLASISKTFVIIAAMQMVELHRRDLDTDINQYLPSNIIIIHSYFPDVTITSRYLLSHTSGIGVNNTLELVNYLPGDSFIQTNLSDTIAKYLTRNTIQI